MSELNTSQEYLCAEIADEIVNRREVSEVVQAKQIEKTKEIYHDITSRMKIRQKNEMIERFVKSVACLREEVCKFLLLLLLLLFLSPVQITKKRIIPTKVHTTNNNYHKQQLAIMKEESAEIRLQNEQMQFQHELAQSRMDEKMALGQAFLLPEEVDFDGFSFCNVENESSTIRLALDTAKETIDVWNASKTFDLKIDVDLEQDCSEQKGQCCAMKSLELVFQPWKDNQQARLGSIAQIFSTLAEQNLYYYYYYYYYYYCYSFLKKNCLMWLSFFSFETKG
ncbi:hypothetical protein RFI_23460 [Reticulomyxa filosa]|uniref:Uncharacterized protein n=1 Tax=Reticulomyxa filosa TaxID=46433 RepID=X6MKF0_RETFI|nr:hypothetical protein RFI_23460 [Reticulomyxa filosa]|eukprot:ETO13907.1 hypothetical protein RFI_23460 [Reticulomyxa filosa]